MPQQPKETLGLIPFVLVIPLLYASSFYFISALIQQRFVYGQGSVASLLGSFDWVAQLKAFGVERGGIPFAILALYIVLAKVITFKISSIVLVAASKDGLDNSVNAFLHCIVPSIDC
jgi:hypothetical protein